MSEWKAKDIHIGEPDDDKVRGRMLVLIPRSSLGPDYPKTDEYREYNRWGDKIYYREVTLCHSQRS